MIPARDDHTTGPAGIIHPGYSKKFVLPMITIL